MGYKYRAPSTETKLLNLHKHSTYSQELMESDDRTLIVALCCIIGTICSIGMLTLMGLIPDHIFEIVLALSLLTLSCFYTMTRRRIAFDRVREPSMTQPSAIRESGKLVGLTVETMLLIVVASILVYLLIQFA